jgi:hypothetical protein
MPINRETWKFPYPADELTAAARDKLKYYQSRLDWWTAMRDEKIKEIKADGIVITESLVSETKFAMSNTYRPPGVSIDNELVAQVQECNSKIADHRRNVRDYTAWVQVLAAQGGAVQQLDKDDWLFFFGDVGPQEEEED